MPWVPSYAPIEPLHDRHSFTISDLSAEFGVTARALRFYEAVRARDRAIVTREIKDFVIPYINIRNRNKGYAVSIVKAGLTVVGRPAGPVRPPLTDLTASERDELGALIRNVHPGA